MLVGVVAAACSPAKTDTSAKEVVGDLRLIATSHPCPSAPGWETVSITLDSRLVGKLEVEVVDRWDPNKNLKRLMGPNDVRYALARVANEQVSAGSSTTVHWAFGNGMPAPQPEDSDACRPLHSAYPDLQRDYEDPKMCTREVAGVGSSGSASSLFAPSCFTERGFVPHRLERELPAAGAAGRWHWIAAWVWAPPSAKVTLSETADGWTAEIGGKTLSPATSSWPAWTLRAKLDVEGPAPPVP